MSHDTERKPQAPTAPISAEGISGATDPNHKKSLLEKFSRKQKLTLAAGGLAVVTAAGVIFGVHNAQGTQSRDIPSASQPSGEATPSTPEVGKSSIPVSSYEALNQNGGEFSAEALSKLSPEQLTSLFQIKASEFTTIKNGKMPTDPADVTKFGQEYTKVLGQRIEAWENAGCTKAEWTPYKNSGKGAFEAAGVAKYNAPISKGILGYESSPDFLNNSLNRCNVMFMDNQTVYNKVDIIDGSTSAVSQGNGLVDVSAIYHYTDNYDLRKTLGDKPAYAPADFNVKWSMDKVTINADGAIVPGSLNIAVTS